MYLSMLQKASRTGDQPVSNIPLMAFSADCNGSSFVTSTFVIKPLYPPPTKMTFVYFMLHWRYIFTFIDKVKTIPFTD